MALTILSDCINCSICEPECPNLAISYDTKKKIYVIDPDLCTECVGFYDKPTCDAVCPINCIEKDPNHVEEQAVLFKKYQKLYNKL